MAKKSLTWGSELGVRTGGLNWGSELVLRKKHTAYVFRSYALSSRVELIVLLYCNTAGKSLETNNGSCYKHTAYELGGRVGVGETQCCARCCVA